MQFGVSYFGVRNPQHFQRDLEDIARLGFTSISFTFSEEDHCFYQGSLTEFVRRTHQQGLKAFVDPWGAAASLEVRLLASGEPGISKDNNVAAMGGPCPSRVPTRLRCVRICSAASLRWQRCYRPMPFFGMNPIFISLWVSRAPRACGAAVARAAMNTSGSNTGNRCRPQKPWRCASANRRRSRSSSATCPPWPPGRGYKTSSAF